MGPLEQRLHDEHVERHERLWRPRLAWRTPRVTLVAYKRPPMRAADAEPADLALHRLVRRAANISLLLAFDQPIEDDALPLPRPQARLIQAIVARFYRIELADMLSQRRSAYIVHPRMVAVYLVQRFTRRSLPEIGRAFGGRDHTTVLHALRKIERLRQVDPRLADELQLLTMRVCEATGWHEDGE